MLDDDGKNEATKESSAAWRQKRWIQNQEKENPNPRKAKDIRMRDAGDYFVVEIKDERYVRGYKQRTYRKKVTTVMAGRCPKLYAWRAREHRPLHPQDQRREDQVHQRQV